MARLRSFERRLQPIRVTTFLFCLILAFPVAGWSRVEEEGGPGDDPAAFPSLLVTGAVGERVLEISAGPGSHLDGPELELRNYVDIRYGDLRLQADVVFLQRETKDCRAEGDVVIQTPNMRITADSAEFNLKTGLGIFYNAQVRAEPSVLFSAEEVERIGEDRFLIRKGEFTTCTQPTPYWSFRVGRGLIHLDRYAHLHNLTLRVNGVPTLYSPYLLWPIKEDRATGLLIPEIGYSENRGSVISNAFYWAMRRNMDATFFLDFFGKDKIGAGLEYRFVPNSAGAGRFAGYFQEEQDTGESRWFAGFREVQKFGRNLRFLADTNFVSDGNYYQDFERDLRIGTNPSALSTLNLAWSRGLHSLNIIGQRREQFFTTGTLDQIVLPEVELRGSRRSLGGSPLLLSFVTSVDHFRKETSSYTANYERVDVAPTLSAPLRLAPWFRMEPSLQLRDTFYTQSLPGGTLVDETLNRRFYLARLDLIGPTWVKVFSRPPGRPASSLRHTIEPRVIYRYSRLSDNADSVIPFDEVDQLSTERNQVSFGFTMRLFANMRDPGPESLGAASSVREVASMTLSQDYSFDNPLSVSATLGDDSSLSPVRLLFRFNPSPLSSIHLNTTYDILFDNLSSTSISTQLRKPGIGSIDFSWFQQRIFEVGTKKVDTKTEQVRLLGEGAFFRGKVILGAQTSFDLERSELLQRRFRIGYNTQCCGFQVEYLDRGFLGSGGKEFRFMVDLKGVGTVVDFHTGTAASEQTILY